MARRPYYLAKRGRVWYVRWNRESGVVRRDDQHARSTGQTTRRAAETWCVRRMAKGRRAGADVTLATYLAPYYVWGQCPHIRRLIAVGASIGRAHAAATRTRIEQHVLPHPIAEMRLGDITRGDLIDLQADLVGEGVGKRSINQIFAALKVVFREAVAREDLDRNPAAHLENIRYQSTERGVFTLDELRRLFPLTPPGPWQGLLDHTMFLLAWTAGMRKGELLALRWANVDLGSAVVRVDEARKGYSAEVGAPKWGRRREEPLCGQAVARLRDLWEESPYRSGGDLVFSSSAGKMLGDWWWHTRFVEALRAVGISDAERKQRNLVPHGFRHCLVTHLRDRVNDAILRDVVGHSSEAMTNDYTHFTIDQKRAVSNELDQLLS